MIQQTKPTYDWPQNVKERVGIEDSDSREIISLKMKLVDWRSALRQAEFLKFQDRVDSISAKIQEFKNEITSLGGKDLKDQKKGLVKRRNVGFYW